jgi:hybrid polyketide synthase / nonribosomal peptide synthetase ACE1
VDVFDSHTQVSLMQIQGVRVTAFSERSSKSDRQLFSEHIWGPAMPDGRLAANNRATTADYELAEDLERLTIYYMKRLSDRFTPEVRSGMKLEWHHQALFDFVTHVLWQTQQGKQRFVKTEWLHDNWEHMVSIIEK